MKKVFMTLAIGAIAASVNAAYWNVDWCIYDAYSPYASGSYPAAATPALQDDFNITWSLVYCAEQDAVQVDPLTGQLVAGTYTLIDQMTAAAGDPDGTLTWTDPVPGGATVSFDKTLYTEDNTRYLGNAPDSGTYNVYQHILIENANDIFYWINGKDGVKPTTDLSAPVEDLGAGMEVGPKAVTDANTYWQPVGVPEPATLSLLGLGALAMVIRRKVRK